MRKKRVLNKITKMHKFGIRIGTYVQTDENEVGIVEHFNENYDIITLKMTDGKTKEFRLKNIKIVLTKTANPEYFL